MDWLIIIIAAGGTAGSVAMLGGRNLGKAWVTPLREFVPRRKKPRDALAELHDWHVERRAEKMRELAEWDREFDRLDPPPFTKKDRQRSLSMGWRLNELTSPITLTSPSGMTRMEWTRSGWELMSPSSPRISHGERAIGQYMRTIKM